jgi:RNA polymerase sigma factor (sigma-70 family)
LPSGAGQNDIWKWTAPVSRRSREEDAILVATLISGDSAAWADFVDRFSSAIFGAVVNTLRKSGFNVDDSTDVAQDVFVRLCKDDFRLLRQFDPKRAGLKTWLGVISASATIDFLRKQRGNNTPIEDLPEEIASVAPVTHDPVRIPEGLLSDRQGLVLHLLYDKDMDAAEVAGLLGIDSQTVRSTHHKALVKLRKYFAEEND